MEQAHVNYRSVAQRLVLASIGMLALVLLAISIAMSAIAERQSRERIVASVAEKAQSVANSVDAFDATARALVERAFGPFRETFDPVLVLDEGTGKLSSFGVPLNDEYSAVDKFSKDTGGVATVFARKGEDFVRIATSVKQDNGERAQGTLLERSDPAYAAVVAGKVYTGRTSLSGKPYMALYQPMKDAAGKVAGVLFVGFDLTGFQNSLEKLVGEARFFDSGGVYIIAPGAKPDEASFVVHASAKGKKVLQAYPAADKFLQALATTPTGHVPDAPAIFASTQTDQWAVMRKATAANWWVVAEVSDREAMRSHWTTMYMQWALLMLATLLLGAGLYWLVQRYVSRPLRALTGAVHAVSQGDLTQTFATRQHDEIGALVDEVEGMRQRYLQALSQVRLAVDSIGTASAEIANGNQDLSSRTEQTASNLQRTASSMDQLTGTVRQSADAARQANQLAASAAEVAARGGTVVGQVVATMDDINHSSKKIADIIGVIDGIAFQTNILALNAAVEAARAGEQGRGFAVVAGEVRSLAQRSAEAAKEIKSLIGASVERVESGSRLVKDAGSTMAEIVSSVQRVGDIIGEISAASSEQSQGIGEVNQSIGQLDQMTQQNAALVEQSAAAAESLREQAQRLTQAVSVFKLGQSPAPARPAVAGGMPRAALAAPARRPQPPKLRVVASAAPQRAALPAAAPSETSTAPAALARPQRGGESEDWETF